MVNREKKIRQIVQFVRKHPESLASRSVLRRLLGSDYEISEELFRGLENLFKNSNLEEDEIDACYDLIK